eukprot:CAMPEP_0170088172 /NCGR_PEP_ID=MMETSP0019_2-20121128/22486_1 /TAXON_ID=98059 /ORGANISM="Dinobryon sp., Strain UTEXLB2267" /LENGTH=170 /DNA_ID=CAMNT_0010306229 /DNA_START=482 /DNA_END=991 /DNA_ORIENTATION=-
MTIWRNFKLMINMLSIKCFLIGILIGITLACNSGRRMSMFLGDIDEVDIGTVNGNNNKNLTVVLLPQTQFVRNCANDSKLFPDRHKKQKKKAKSRDKNIIADFVGWMNSESTSDALQQDLEYAGTLHAYHPFSLRRNMRPVLAQAVVAHCVTPTGNSHAKKRFLIAANLW